LARATTKRTVSKARILRKEMSLPEVLLWRLLRASPEGIKFRRQHPIGSYVLDFYCPSVRIGIEIDGIVHDMGDRAAHDDARTAWLHEQKIELLRIPASDVLSSVDQIAVTIVSACRKAE
jgi:very-short-patch-repair endonuclease